MAGISAYAAPRVNYWYRVPLIARRRHRDDLRERTINQKFAYECIL
jgi:hypothetical protein